MIKSEVELLELYRNGCNESLSLIYSRYYNLLTKASKKYLCNNQDAEDLIQSVIEKLLSLTIEKRIQRFSNIQSVPSFFYTIIKNASLDYLRKKKISCVSLEYVTNQVEELDEIATIELEYENIGLSQSEMMCFEAYINGKKPKEISLKFSKTISTTKNTLNNAKKKIIKYYQSQISLEE
jgi:RNA polymerase sigma factor (sigma-70 family)